MLVKYRPMTQLSNWEPDFDRWMDRFFNNESVWSAEGRRLMPAMNLEESKDGFHLTLELPGMKKDDINVSLQDNMLTISGEKKIEDDSNDRNFQHRERIYGQFCRNVELPDMIDADKIQADYENGILRIDIPKSEKAKPKEIEVKVK